MSRQNGDRSRFQINRKRKLRLRQRVRALRTALAERRAKAGDAATPEPSGAKSPRQ